jgi:hypothetical protein
MHISVDKVDFFYVKTGGIYIKPLCFKGLRILERYTAGLDAHLLHIKLIVTKFLVLQISHYAEL